MEQGDAVNAENQRIHDERLKQEKEAGEDRIKWGRAWAMEEGDRINERNQAEQDALDARIKAREQADQKYNDALRDDLKGAFSAAFRDTSGEPLQAFGDAIANVIYSRAATALAESFISSGSGSGGGGLGGFFSSLFSFDGGGYTGSGSRSGGVDGRGGFMAIMHPNESVLDHTRGQGNGGMVVNIVEAPGKGGQTSKSSSGGSDVLTVFVEQVKASIASDISRGSGAVPGAMSSTYGLNRVAGAY